MWINGGSTPVEEEGKCIRSSCLYFFATHADRHTLRNGISLIINTANTPKKKVGNERKLQVVRIRAGRTRDPAAPLATEAQRAPLSCARPLVRRGKTSRSELRPSTFWASSCLCFSEP